MREGGREGRREKMKEGVRERIREGREWSCNYTYLAARI